MYEYYVGVVYNVCASLIYAFYPVRRHGVSFYY